MNEPGAVVLVVEDEPKIRRFIRLSLEREGCQVVEADSVRQGLSEAGTRHPALVLLDLGLPDGDGLDFIRALRGWSEIPIIVLSARTTERDKVAALDAGADDYLTKPFGVAELLARVRAQRRRQAVGAAPGAVIDFGAIRVDCGRRIVERAGQPLHLTPIEYSLLIYLATHPHAVLTHRQLLRQVWGPSHADHSHYVRVYMASLRKKIEEDPSRPQHLITETGIGYRFIP
ncbi:response regulator [Thiobaca trueperi]|uniref:Two-component system KDP operon response regulator KdpE n=1 Tax=Thiobaca trueperi TaxID=127458 RepID=A0A4R3N553_9GAMM|nr:response regulator [Thiobaca trueperi]TCT24320.1 two-component system KDP operon response regulator KdpE [Thiobaca trueperi]